MPDLERIKKFKDRVADTATSVADSAQGTLQKTSGKVTDTASSVAGAVQDASQKASVQATDAAASVVWSAQDALAGASEKVTDTAASVADSAQGTLQKTSGKVTDTASSVAGAAQDASQKASVKATDAAASAVWSAQDALQEASEKVTDTAASVAGSAQDTLQKTSEKVTDTASSVAGTLQDASSKASVKATDVAASAVWSAQDASEKVTDTAASAAGTVRETAQKAPDVATATAKQVTSGTKGALEATTGAVQDAAQKAPELTTAAAEKVTSGAKTALQSTTGAVQNAAQEAPNVAMAAVESVKTNPKEILEATTSAANALLSTTQGLLASDLAGAANDLVQGMVKGVPTIYDKAMDAKFIETGIGGANHRLFDGGHTIWGAFTAAREASPDDNIIQEALGTVQGLLRDVSTPKGLPLVTWDKDTFDQVAGALESNYHIPKDWFVDLATYDVADLLGGTVGAVSLIFNWNSADTETFTRLVGSMGLSATVGANPLLLIVSVVALGRAFHKAHLTGEYAAFTDGLFKGGLSSGATLAAVGIVGLFGGPAGVGLVASLVVGVLTQKAAQNISVVEIGQVVARQAGDAAAEATSLVAPHIPAIL